MAHDIIAQNLDMSRTKRKTCRNRPDVRRSNPCGTRPARAFAAIGTTAGNASASTPPTMSADVGTRHGTAPPSGSNMEARDGAQRARSRAQLPRQKPFTRKRRSDDRPAAAAQLRENPRAKLCSSISAGERSKTRCFRYAVHCFHNFSQVSFNRVCGCARMRAHTREEYLYETVKVVQHKVKKDYI